MFHNIILLSAKIEKKFDYSQKKRKKTYCLRVGVVDSWGYEK